MNPEQEREYGLNWTRDEYWAEPPNFRNLKIANKPIKFDFTRKWFRDRNQISFSSYLLDKFSPEEPLNVIQIGVFEGMGVTWLFQHLLHNPDSRLLAIDPWAATTKYDQDKMDQVSIRAKKNLTPYAGQIRLERKYSQSYLKQVQKGVMVQGKIIKPLQWDIAVIDGDHNCDPVFEDAELCLALVKPGGWLIFDDVRSKRLPRRNVKGGVRKFLDKHHSQVKLAWAHRYMNAYEVL